jgi:hypothetical protein
MEILDICRSEFSDKRVAEIPELAVENLTREQAILIREEFKGKLFLKLPEHEVKFFEWVKAVDRPVWDDLWGGESAEDAYLVSVEFLPCLVKSGRGFPICDLLENDNYYFTKIHLADKESDLLVDTIKQRFLNKDKLTIAQTLLMEMSLDPIDIWRFAHKYSLNIEKAKEAVSQLLDDKLIVHIKSAEHLANFIEI